MAEVNEKIAGVSTIDASSITSGTIDAARMYVAIDTYASLPSGVPTGTLAWCTDGLGFPVRYTGTRWVSQATHIMWTPLQAEVTTDNTGSLQIIWSALLPAGFLGEGYVIELDQIFYKSGVTDSTELYLTIGTSGVIGGGDAVIFTNTYPSMTARMARFNPIIRIKSATSVSSSFHVSIASSSGNAFPADVTIANISNPLYIQVRLDLSGTTDTVTLKSSQMKITRSS